MELGNKMVYVILYKMNDNDNLTFLFVKGPVSLSWFKNLSHGTNDARVDTITTKVFHDARVVPITTNEFHNGCVVSITTIAHP